LIGLATVNGITRDQAQDQYLAALAALVEYSAKISGWDMLSPAYESYLIARCHVPSPYLAHNTVAVQCRTHCAINPPAVRTIEVVSA
jgi:hypothetical protein